MSKSKIKKWCLLDDGTIEHCYYQNGEMRNIYNIGNDYFLDHDRYAHNMIIYCHSRIVKFADTTEELLDEIQKRGLR